MGNFPNEVSIAIYHYNSTTDQYPSSASSTVSGDFLPLDRKDHAFTGLGFSDVFEIYVDPATDILVSDKVVISSSTYFVKHIFTADFGGLPHKRATILKEV